MDKLKGNKGQIQAHKEEITHMEAIDADDVKINYVCIAT